jgi:transcription initiation factor TFIIIB Brf1 subunit/transcription initiation factor TFIIB
MSDKKHCKLKKVEKDDNAKFVCKKCGSNDNKEKHLCKPIKKLQNL